MTQLFQLDVPLTFQSFKIDPAIAHMKAQHLVTINRPRAHQTQNADQSKTKTSRLWEIVSTWLVEQISNGTLSNGEKLPSIRTLSNQFNVSVATVQRALDHLERMGMTQTIPRSGSFVVSPLNTEKAYDFAGVDVRVDKAVASMLADAARPETHTLGSAVLGQRLAPETLLKRCIAAVARNEEAVSAFSPPPGSLALRKQIAGIMMRRGVLCGPDDIVVTAGDTVAMELGLMATGKALDRVIVEDPTYFGILQAIEHVGMRAVPIKTCPIEGIDLEIVQEALNNGPYAAIFLNPTLQNPLGFVMPTHRRMKLAEMAAKAGVTIIEDDVFFDLLAPVHQPPAVKSFDPENVIYCSSFTKTIAPGFRIGWCLPGKHKEAVLAQMFGRNLSVSSLPQKVLTEFMRRGYAEEHLVNLRQNLSQSSKKLAAMLDKAFPSDIVYHPPVAGFVHWITLPSSVDMDRFHHLIKQAHIVIANGQIFSALNGSTHGVRICLADGFSEKTQRLIAEIGACAIEASLPIKSA